jgi:uncharacterized protein YfdQ (DUF2303 family)
VDNAIDQGTAEFIRELADASSAVGTVEGGNTPYLLHPADYKVTTLEALIQNDRSERPHRIKQAVEVWDAASFIEYFIAFRDHSSRVFADVNVATVTSVLDYHEWIGEETHNDTAVPRWGSHKLTLSLKKSPEWLLWIASNKKTMDQDTFATFIEDNAPDIVDPSAATMKEIASDLHETHEMTFAGKATTPNGSQKISFTQENKSSFGKADATVPESFKVGIPVYIGGERVQLVARLRWRVAGGKATFWYDLLRDDAAERAAFDATRAQVAEAIGAPIISGVAR